MNRESDLPPFSPHDGGAGANGRSSLLIRIPHRRWSGTGVRVAVVDSGVNARHSHVRGVALALRACDGKRGEVRWVKDSTDRIGHGTAVAAVIRQKAPLAEIISLKVFDDTLITRMRYVLAAIQWAAEQGVHVVNLSLGSDNPDHIPALQEAAERAIAGGTLLVASAEAGGEPTFPAALPGFIGVRTDPHCDEWSYSVWPDEPLPFGACGYPRSLPDRPPSANFRGTSFAAAHMTGFIALLVEASGTTEGVVDALLEGTLSLSDV